MTTLLSTAFKKASSLSEIEQNRFAQFLIQEIESETKWNKLFEKSEDILEDMANLALNEYEDNKTTLLKKEEL